MSVSAADRKLLFIGSGLIAATILAVAVLQPSQENDLGYPSSYNVKRHGGKAAFLLLKQSGYDIERWDRAPVELPADGHGVLLIVTAPAAVFERDDSNAFRKFIVSGGTALLTGDAAGYGLSEMGAGTGTYRVENATIDPAAPSGLSRGGPITMGGRTVWLGSDVSPMIHYAYLDEPVVASFNLGQGHVIWWADPRPLTNEGIREEHNLDLLINSVEGARKILWDEYPYREPKEVSLGLAGVALRGGMWQLTAFAAFLVFTYSRRSGPLVPKPEVSRLSPLEFVDTLGNLYQRAGARQTVIEIALGRFRQMFARRLGPYDLASAEEIAQAVALRGVAVPPDFARQLRRCQEAISDPGLTQKEAIHLVQFLNDAAGVLRLAKGRGSESHNRGPEA